MVNLTEFRQNFFIQQEYALITGRTIQNLLTRSAELHGNTRFNTFLYKTQSTSNPINWLDEDQCLNASINGLKQASQEITSLEKWLGLSYSEILSALAYKHNTSSLEQLFNGSPNEEWANVTKGDVKSLLEEFDWWCDFLNTLDIHEHDFESAQDLLVFLEQPLLKQLKRLVDVVQITTANWELDADVFANINRGLRENNKDFLPEWLVTVNPSAHYNAKSHREYTSLHSWFFLSIMAHVYGYESNLWATKSQWKKLGYELKQEAKIAPVFHYFKIENVDELGSFDSEDKQLTESSFGRKISIVYNADEVIGYTGKSFSDTKVKDLAVLTRRIEELSINIEYSKVDGTAAAYYYESDLIKMPHKELFKAKDSTKAYYATLLHEMVHWTGHETRCNREFGRFGDNKYAFEELVAEIGSSFLCARFGITKKVRASSIQYIAHWLGQLDDKEWINHVDKSATLANRASNFIYVPKRDD
ncbi:Antirestriction protein ArdC [Shewanella morhuae]|uniref:zincin-like metallopeptidase domain-containing protein n=1 Tax=Shewanella morhuae TaxID=365591 RepID=UPI0009572FF5|nr:zincin-like metallopeptidase domain-containing protein [Shewanella morhuae]SIR36564.1 Antirestriction protein ArdC [Shewanella morhuae]